MGNTGGAYRRAYVPGSGRQLAEKDTQVGGKVFTLQLHQSGGLRPQCVDDRHWPPRRRLQPQPRILIEAVLDTLWRSRRPAAHARWSDHACTCALSRIKAVEAGWMHACVWAPADAHRCRRWSTRRPPIWAPCWRHPLWPTAAPAARQSPSPPPDIHSPRRAPETPPKAPRTQIPRERERVSEREREKETRKNHANGLVNDIGRSLHHCALLGTDLMQLGHGLVAAVARGGAGAVGLADDQRGRRPMCLGVLEHHRAPVLQPVVVGKAAAILYRVARGHRQ
jgi:hypothetical protein